MKHLLRFFLRVPRWSLGVLIRNGQNVITAFVQIWANKGRSILTTLGIIIAVTSIITVVSLVDGFGRYVTEMVRGYGTQFMVVHPETPSRMHRAGMRRVTLDFADIEAVRTESSKISRITPFVYTHDAQIAYGTEKAAEVPVRGVTEVYQTIRNFFVDTGRFFGPVDVANHAHVVVLGRSVLRGLAADDSIVGDHVYIDGTRFLVIGILQPKGSMMGKDQDETVMIPFTTAITLYPERRTAMPFLAEAATEADIDEADATNPLFSRYIDAMP